jgi:hypothetical protein
MPYDIDWETACNDFHPAFALVRGERYVPNAAPIRHRLDRGVARAAAEPGMKDVRLDKAILAIPELSR